MPLLQAYHKDTTFPTTNNMQGKSLDARRRKNNKEDKKKKQKKDASGKVGQSRYTSAVR